MNKFNSATLKLIGVILTISIASISSCTNNNTKPHAALNSANNAVIRVEVIKVKSAADNDKLSYSGTTTPVVTTPLSFLLPSSVVAIHAEEGDVVKKGQLLAELNSTSYTNAHNATLASEQQAQDAYNRLKTIHDKGSLPEIQWEEIKAKLVQAKSANQIALQNLSNCKLKAPSDGIIGVRNIEIGTNSIPGNPVFNLVSLHEVYVKVSIPENEISQIKRNQSTSIKIPALGGQSFNGKVEKIGVLANPISKTYEIKIRIPNPQMNIKPGMGCDVIVDTEPTEELLAVPYQSVIKDEKGQTFVYTVLPKSNTVTKQPVKLGSFSNNSIEVLSGLSQGDLVVSSGQHKLYPKAEVIF